MKENVKLYDWPLNHLFIFSADGGHCLTRPAYRDPALVGRSTFLYLQHFKRFIYSRIFALQLM